MGKISEKSPLFRTKQEMLEELGICSKMQPLSYQLYETSCWVTSMMNGLLVLHRNKNEIPKLAYRLLHTVLTNEGVLSTGKFRKEWEVVLKAVSDITDLKITNHFAEKVTPAIAALDFEKQVAICDTQAGRHSILLTGRRGTCLEGFDPDWDNIVGGDVNPERYWTYPDGECGAQSWINFRVEVAHFTSVTRGMSTALRMGPIPSRTLTVIDRR